MITAKEFTELQKEADRISNEMIGMDFGDFPPDIDLKDALKDYPSGYNLDDAVLEIVTNKVDKYKRAESDGVFPTDE